jgi:hypothetical protein
MTKAPTIPTALESAATDCNDRFMVVDVVTDVVNGRDRETKKGDRYDKQLRETKIHVRRSGNERTRLLLVEKNHPNHVCVYAPVVGTIGPTVPGKQRRLLPYRSSGLTQHSHRTSSTMFITVRIHVCAKNKQIEVEEDTKKLSRVDQNQVWR